MFVDHYSTVPPELLALRSVVLEKKKVRTHTQTMSHSNHLKGPSFA
jgi:hypothetical protein